MNPVNDRPLLAKRAMNAARWTIRVPCGVFSNVTGFGKVPCYKPDVWNQTLDQVAWFAAVPQGLLGVIGVCEFLGGIGLILPAMTGVKSKLTVFAALKGSRFRVLVDFVPVWCKLTHTD
jgi:hypothetical protein